MYCSYCGKKIDDKNATNLSIKNLGNYEDIPSDVKTSIICPRCGHLIHEDLSEDEVKSLSRASHAALQRGRNDFAKGMCSLSLFIITLILSIIFILLSKKAENQMKITLTSPEFWVGLSFGIISVILLVYGSIMVSRGLFTKHRYTNLLKDINNKTFVQ